MRRVWFDRTFELGYPVEALPDLIERLRGTPARLEERVADIAGPERTARHGDRWSIQENVGHLIDLEALWAARMDDFDAGRETLAAADLQNRATHDARHNETPIEGLLATFRARRAALVARFEALDGAGGRRSALHPRLRQPMSAVDLAFFVAEHDDHHLARITEILRGEGD